VNISIDAPLLAIIDATAERVNMTRSGLVEALARRHLAEFN
jgi:metal-responsive CopG/Arc/MetJ family transcriptional regulator